MAVVSMNNNKYEGFTIQIGSSSLSQQFLSLTSSVIQSYEVKINSGTPFIINGVTQVVNIPYTCSFSNEILTMEIVAINGGLLSNITRINSSSTLNFVITNITTILKFTNLEELTINGNGGLSNIVGNIIDLPASITILNIPNSLVGSFSDFKNTVTRLNLISCNTNATVIGTFSDLPTSLEYLTLNVNVSGKLQLSGNLGSAPNTLEFFYGYVYEAMTVDTNNLPPNIKTISMFNSGSPNTTLVGDIADFPSSLTQFRFEEALSDTLSGNIDDLPSNMNLFALFDFSSTNTISGDIANMPTNLSFFVVKGNNTIGGNLNSVPAGVGGVFSVEGNNVITGTIQSYTGVFGSLNVKGLNTISGDLGLIGQFTNINIGGNNTIADYTSPPLVNFKNTNAFYVVLKGNNTLSSAEVDNLLIDIDSDITVGTSLTIEITGGAGARTAVSDTAYNSLIAKGYNIILN